MLKTEDRVLATNYRFTREQYHEMAKSGILHEDDRVELLEGRVVVMSPIGKRHAFVVRRLNNLLAQRLSGRALVDPQNPLALGEEGEPEPDLMILKAHPSDYADRLPGPDDVLLLIEVADSSVDADKEVKIPLYAKYAVPEVWLIDLSEEIVEVYTHPTQSGYSRTKRLHSDDELTVSEFSDIVIDVGFLFGSTQAS